MTFLKKTKPIQKTQTKTQQSTTRAAQRAKKEVERVGEKTECMA